MLSINWFMIQFLLLLKMTLLNMHGQKKKPNVSHNYISYAVHEINLNIKYYKLTSSWILSSSFTFSLILTYLWKEKNKPRCNSQVQVNSSKNQSMYHYQNSLMKDKSFYAIFKIYNKLSISMIFFLCKNCCSFDEMYMYDTCM